MRLAPQLRHDSLSLLVVQDGLCCRTRFGLDQHVHRLAGEVGQDEQTFGGWSSLALAGQLQPSVAWANLGFRKSPLHHRGVKAPFYPHVHRDTRVLHGQWSQKEQARQVLADLGAGSLI
jgi:hypothetical protein